MSMNKQYRKEANKDGIIKVSKVENRNFPDIEGVDDFTHISKNAVYLDGYSPKWAGRVDKQYLEELIFEVLENPECSYETCYTNDAFVGYVPRYFSAVIKRLDTATEVDYDVLGSRLLNYLGVPTVFNVRAEGKIKVEDGNEENVIMVPHLISVDFIRENEEFYDLYDVYSGEKFDIQRVFDNGLARTTLINKNMLKIFLKNNGINYTDEDLKNYERILAKSIVSRAILLADKDVRNANAGILINRKNKTFRFAPNHDFNDLLNRKPISGEEIRILDEYATLYPEDHDELIRKFSKLVEKNKYGSSDLGWIVQDSVEDVYDQNRVMKILTNIEKRIASNEMEKSKTFEN